MSIVPSAPPDASGTVRGFVNLVAQTFAGAKTFLATIVASAGIQVASLFNNNGTGSTDVGVRVGVSTADGSVNATAELLRIATGIGGTEVRRSAFTKTGLTFWGAGFSALKWDNGTPGVSWQIEAQPGTGTLRFGNNTSTYFGLRFSDGYAVSEFGYEFSVGGTTYLKTRLGAVDQWGTDTSGSPGAQTINKPSGKSAIAAGASAVVITNSLVTAASRVMITPHARDATCKEIIAVPGSGIITVSGTANATAALPFSWQVSNIL
jgi:hypothetical protein